MYYVKEYYFEDGKTAVEIVVADILTSEELRIVSKQGFYTEEKASCDYYCTTCKTLAEAKAYKMEVLSA